MKADHSPRSYSTVALEEVALVSPEPGTVLLQPASLQAPDGMNQRIERRTRKFWVLLLDTVWLAEGCSNPR